MSEFTIVLPLATSSNLYRIEMSRVAAAGVKCACYANRIQCVTHSITPPRPTIQMGLVSTSIHPMCNRSFHSNLRWKYPHKVMDKYGGAHMMAL